ncbi:MAG: hypothetical protein LBN99_02090, partial [Oscillospiraceae bacterium]|nr:hypothetical protein [Oscillospiraceae bacterium]
MAVVLGLALLLTLSAIAISTTLAAKNEIVEEFSIPDSDPNIRVIEVGQTLTRPVGGAYNWANSNPGALSMTAATGSISAVLTGQQAGNAVISVGTRTGIVQGLKYQITNSNNITKYILSNGGEGIIGKVGGTLTIPIRTFVTPFGASNPEETAFAKNTITWSSFRQGDPVASVSASGVVTGLSKGATILIGKFTDKWGQPQEAHFLVAVGVSINDSDLGKLLELIEEAQ